jgi:hypothetical protein
MYIFDSKITPFKLLSMQVTGSASWQVVFQKEAVPSVVIVGGNSIKTLDKASALTLVGKVSPRQLLLKITNI